jgi:hypothetical protein
MVDVRKLSDTLKRAHFLGTSQKSWEILRFFLIKGSEGFWNANSEFGTFHCKRWKFVGFIVTKVEVSDNRVAY